MGSATATSTPNHHGQPGPRAGPPCCPGPEPQTSMINSGRIQGGSVLSDCLWLDRSSVVVSDGFD